MQTVNCTPIMYTKNKTEHYRTLFAGHDKVVETIINEMNNNELFTINKNNPVTRKRKYSESMGYDNEYISVQKYK